MGEGKGLTDWTLSRRTFLRATGVLGATLALAESQAGLLRKTTDLVSAAPAEAEGETVIPTICGICPGKCGVNAYVKDGRLVRVDVLEGHPQPFQCVRGKASTQVVYSPDRLKYPLKRVGERGEGKFERITWEEAHDIITKKLTEVMDKYGPEAISDYAGRGNFGEPEYGRTFRLEGDTASNNMVFLLGSPNKAGAGSICRTSYGRSAPVPTFGREPTPDYRNANLIVIWGCNPSTDSPPTKLQPIFDALDGGAQLIVIDPMFAELATKGIWVPIRPGTDGALALGIMRYIINEGLYDADFVRDWTVGFDELREYVQQFTPEKVEEITWIPADTVQKVAHMMATIKPACTAAYTGLEYTNSGVQNIRAVMLVGALAGNLDVKGGNIFSMPGVPTNRIVIKAPNEPKPVGYDEYPYFCDDVKAMQFSLFPQAVLEGKPYPVRALIVGGASTLTQWPNPGLFAKALKALDLLVVIDRFMTADAELADVVLPASTYYERLRCETYSGYVQAGPKAIEPLWESRDDFTIWYEIVKQLGHGDKYPETREKLIEFVLEPSGVTLAQLEEHPEGIAVEKTPMVYKKYEKGLLRKDGQPGFDTPSGKVEIASSILAKYGYDALPVYTEPIEGPISRPDLAEKYPLVFNSGARIHATFHSQHRNIPWLNEIQPAPFVVINSKDAAERGIKDGDNVIVETPRGSAPFLAKVTQGITLGVVEVNHAGGSPLAPKAWKEGNANLLTDLDNRDPISGFPVLKALLCNVRKA